MMTASKETPDWIDDLLDDVARTPVPEASTDLLVRVLKDAEHVQGLHVASAAHVHTQTTTHAVKPSFWHEILQGLGGWGPVGGLVAATATGFVIGLGGLPNGGLDSVGALDESVFVQDGLSANGWDWEEG